MDEGLELKLFVWENPTVYIEPIIMLALAPDVETARELIIKKRHAGWGGWESVPDCTIDDYMKYKQDPDSSSPSNKSFYSDLSKEPKVIDKQEAFYAFLSIRKE